jgi:predicted acetylornithine/succinylornithine family transaminase
VSAPPSPARAALLGVYQPPGQLFVRGEGAWLEDSTGRRYLDFTSGIAVAALGHGSPVVREACERALATGLVHTSNLFRTEPAERLAAELVEAAFDSQVFFCNSGAEANEAAFKFARRRAREAGGPDKHEIVAFDGSFHGRLFGTLAATDRPSYREPFEPLMPGVRFATVGDLDSVRAVTSRLRTAAVIVEPVQGEGGVRVVDASFLGALRELCDALDASLILDEVQCGYGRTGDLFAHQAAGLVPDLLTLAKPMAGGLAMGAVLAGPEVARHVRPGDHATTFGGGPLVATVARAVLATLADPVFLEGVRERGRRLEAGLRGLVDRHAHVRAVRGRGLLLGLVLDAPAAPVISAALDAGLLVCAAGPEVVRLLPPLNIEPALLDEGVAILDEVLMTAAPS